MRQGIRHKMTVKNLNTSEYSSYYQPYIDICGNRGLVEGLEYNLIETFEFLKSIPFNRHEYSYDKGKWTIKQLIQHLIDTERIFTYRALRFARNDSTELPGYDENKYVPQSKANHREFIDLIEEFSVVRKSTVSLFKSFNDEMLMRSGKANNNEMSVRAMAFIIIGHCNHHCKVIKERYL